MALQPPSGVIEASMMGEYWRVQRTRNGLRSYYRPYLPMSSSRRSLRAPAKRVRACCGYRRRGAFGRYACSRRNRQSLSPWLRTSLV
jgi:hypothetical protein